MEYYFYVPLVMIDNDDIVEDADIDTWLEFGDDAFNADWYDEE